MTESSDAKTYALFSNANNKKLLADLEERGEKVVKLPRFETEKIDVSAETLEILANPARFDWFIFTDTAAADHFLQILEEAEIDFYELDQVRICAYGEAVSDRLRFAQIHTDVSPNKIEDAEIVEAIKSYVGGEKGLSGQKILIFHQADADVSICEKLSSENADVKILPIYRIIFEDKEFVPKLKALITGGAIDELIVSAPEDLIYLKFLLSSQKIKPDWFEFSATNETALKNLFELEIKARFFHK